MAWPGVDAAQHLQASGGKPAQQLVSAAQTQVFGQIRQDQPALALGRQVGGQPSQVAAQHAAVRVVDGGLQRRTGLGRHPRWVADHQSEAAFDIQVSLFKLDPLGNAQSLKVLRCTDQRGGGQVGGHHLQPTASQHRGEHAGASAHVEHTRRLGRSRQLGLGDQVDILAAHRREDAVVRMDSRTQRRYRHAFLAPLESPDQA